MGNYHVPFWRAVGRVTYLLTLILANAEDDVIVESIGWVTSELNALWTVTPRGVW